MKRSKSRQSAFSNGPTNTPRRHFIDQMGKLTVGSVAACALSVVPGFALASENALGGGAPTFPDIPLYEGWGHPHRLESDLLDLEVVQGEIPKELNGTHYRCGPDRQYPPLFKDDIFIDGEGMSHMFRFENGHVDYKCRWVRNERFLLQEAAQRSLFGRYRNRYTNDPSVAGANQGTANTNIVWHGGKLLVLKEDSLPIEVDPDTLSTIQEWDYDGQVKAVSMTAHPKLDLRTNELLTFSYQAKGDGTTDVVFYIANADGDIEHEVWFNAPYPGMVHDYAVTDEHIIFPFYPLITDMDVVKAGGPYYQWHPEESSYVAILPRRGKAEDIRWFKGPPKSAGHMMGGVTEGSKVHLDVCLYDGNCFPFFPSVEGVAMAEVPPILTRQTFDLASTEEGFTSKVLSPLPCEMPRIDDRFIGKNYRHGYMNCYGQGGGTGHLDYQTGQLKVWNPGPNSSVQEPMFVPRAPDSPEGDGYLLVPVNRINEMRSDLAILDATDIEAGPVALVRLTTRIKSTFHGSWVPAAALESGKYEMYS